MKTAIKVLVLFAVVCALVLGGGYWYVSEHAGELADSTVSSATGSDALGELARKVMSGEDLTDAEIERALGIDEGTYEKLERAARDAGIDLNDSRQLREIVANNADKADDVLQIVGQLQSGALTEEQAAKRLGALIQR